MLIKNRFGRIVEVNPELADAMIKKGEGFAIEAQEVKEEPINPLKCPYCGFEAKNKLGFDKHLSACKKKAL